MTVTGSGLLRSRRRPFECSLGIRIIDHAPRAQKIRRPLSGGGQSVEIFSFGRPLSCTSTLAGSRHLAVSNETGCRIRFFESTPDASDTIKRRNRFVKIRNQDSVARRILSHRADLRRLFPASLSILQDSRPGTHDYDSLKLKVLSSTRTPQSSSCPFCRSIGI
jgi:hypothetical protein